VKHVNHHQRRPRVSFHPHHTYLLLPYCVTIEEESSKAIRIRLLTAIPHPNGVNSIVTPSQRREGEEREEVVQSLRIDSEPSRKYTSEFIHHERGRIGITTATYRSSSIGQ
jgi:hypothetical protein